MAPPQHKNVLRTSDQPEGHDDLRKRNERLAQDLNSMRRKCNEYEKTILFQANEIRNLREHLSLNICEQCKTKLDHTKSQEIELCLAEPSSSSIVFLENGPPQKLGGSHSPVSTSLKSIAAMFKSKSGTRPSVPSSSHAPSSTNHVSTPGRSYISCISSTASSTDDIVNVSSQPSQNLSRIGLSSINDIGTNTVSREQNWSIVFNCGVKRELDVKLVHTLPHRNAVRRVRFSPEGKHLAVAYGKQTGIYDVATGRLICVLADLYEKSDIGIADLCFSPEGRYLAITYGERIYIWEIARKHVRNMFKHPRNGSLDFSSDGRLFVSASYDGTVRVWNMRNNTSRVFSHDRGISSVAFSSDGFHVITGDLDGMITMWNMRTGQLMETVKGHNDWVSSLAFMPDGKGLVSGSLDSTLKYWDVGSLTTYKSPREDKALQKGGDLEGRKSPKNRIQHFQRFIGHTKAVMTVAISPNGRWIVSGSRDNSVGLWDAQNAEMHCMLQPRSGSGCLADLSPTGNYLAASSLDGQVGIWSYNKV